MLNYARGIMIHYHGMFSSIIVPLGFIFIIILFTLFLLLVYIISFQVEYLMCVTKICVFTSPVHIYYLSLHDASHFKISL